MLHLLSNHIEDCYYGEPVVVTSPEQYVPLYLAYMDRVNSVLGSKQINHSMITSTARTLMHEGKIELMKEHLLSVLRHTIPKQYCLPYIKSELVSSNDAIYRSADTSTNMIRIFCGDKVGLGQSNGYVLPGLYYNFSGGGVDNNYTEGVNNKLYRRLKIAMRTNLLNNITPYILVVVKAKWIPILRAHIELNFGSPMIPIGELRLLRSGTPGIYSAQLVRDMLSASGLDQKVRDGELQVEWLDSHQIAKYLGTIPETKLMDLPEEECLESRRSWIKNALGTIGELSASIKAFQ